MEIAKALALFAKNHRAVLATRRRDGRPQLSPVVQSVGNDGRILISTRSGAIKARNISRDPSVSICVLDDAFFGEWAQIDGRAAIIELPEAMPVLRVVYTQVAGEHPDWEEIRARYGVAATCRDRHNRGVGRARSGRLNLDSRPSGSIRPSP